MDDSNASHVTNMTLKMNIGGAKDRPSITEIWEDVQSKMAGKQVDRVSYSTQSFFKVMAAKLMGR